MVVGHNQGDFGAYVELQKAAGEHSGAYRDVKTNSVLFEGRRITFMDLLNTLRQRRDPTAERLSAFGPTNLAACYLTSFLSARGVATQMVNEFGTGKEQLAALLKEEPLAVALTTTFYVDYPLIREVVDFVRERSPRSKIIAGGPWVAGLERNLEREDQDYLLDEAGADLYVIDSQGESTLAEVLGALKRGEADLSSVKNLAYRVGDTWARSGRQEEDNALARNSIDWKIFDPSFLEPFTLTRTAISCPFACSFCSYPVRAGSHRVSDPEVVERELKQLDAMGVRFVYFIDDTFNVPLPRFKELCRMMIKNRFNLRWVSYLRCGNMDDEAIALAAESGCVGALLGIESGDEGVLKNMNKFANPEKYRKSIRALEDKGIMTYAMFFLGFPGETEKSIQNTIRLVNDTQPSFFVTQMWYYENHTPIRNRAAEFALTGSGYSWNHRSMGWHQAADHVEEMLRAIDGPRFVPLTGFSFETVFYLRGKGIPTGAIRDFLGVTRKMVINGLGDRPADTAAEVRALEPIVAAMMA